MEEEIWKYILLNGKTNQLKVKNPVYEKGELKSIDDLKPFNKKDDEGNPVKPTLADANSEKRNIYKEFFKKPFKNLLVLSGAGSSMDVGGLSMWQLWKETEKKYKMSPVKRVEKTKSSFELNT